MPEREKTHSHVKSLFPMEMMDKERERERERERREGEREKGGA